MKNVDDTMTEDEPLQETVCSECEHKPDEETKFCPECGAENPWIERNAYEFDEDDLPIVVSYEFYNDTFGLWDSFCEDYFGGRLKRKHIANLPNNFPKMKYCVHTVYFVVTENLELEGPFVDEEEAERFCTKN